MELPGREKHRDRRLPGMEPTCYQVPPQASFLVILCLGFHA